MEEPIIINRRSIFSLEEARQILPIVRRITSDVSEKVDTLIAELEATPSTEKDTLAALEEEINKHIHNWNTKMKKLGGKPKGLWLVDFDFGRGYYCWKHPETEIQFWHTQDEGFSGRRPLEELKFEKKKEKSSNRARPDQFPPRRL